MTRQESHSQAPPADDATRHSISGAVLNHVTRQPIGRALVYTEDQRFAAFTDDQGRFELDLAPSQPAPNAPVDATSTVFLRASRPGFLPYRSVAATQGQSNVTVLLVPEGLIVGHVKFPSDETGDKVQVQLYHREVRDGMGQWVPVVQDSTRSDGEYRFASLEAGDYKVFTRENLEQGQSSNGNAEPPYGFPPRFFPAARDFATADTIHLQAGETFVANIALERQRYYDVSVPVQGADEVFREGARVSVFAQGHRGPGFELGFDRSQRAIRGSLPNGAYAIQVNTFGPSAGTGVTNITIANGRATGPTLTIVSDPPIEINFHKDMSGAENVHQPQQVIDGRSLAHVSLLSAEEVTSSRGFGMRHDAQSDVPALTGVGPGRYWVQVQPFSGYVASVTSGGKDLLREPLVVPLGGSVPPLEITLRYDTGEVEASLEGSQPEQGTPAGVIGSSTGTTVIVMSRQRREMSIDCLLLDVRGGSPMKSNYRMNGRCIWSQIAPGDYRVLALESAQELEYRNPAVMREYDSKGEAVHVAPGQKAQVTVHTIGNE